MALRSLASTRMISILFFPVKCFHLFSNKVTSLISWSESGNILNLYCIVKYFGLVLFESLITFDGFAF